MDYSIQFEGSGPQDVTITTSGPAERVAFLHLFDELVEHPRFVPGMTVLFDHSNLDAAPLTHDDVRQIGRRAGALHERLAHGAIAIVAPDPLTFGLARTTEAYAAPGGLTTATFSTREEAYAWLREPRETLH